jgi:eukaryotic-like serine/threonine-protein kinase
MRLSLLVTAVLVANMGTVQAAEPACAPPEPGFLTIATVPWTEVMLDGVLVGTTPLYRLAVTPGQHQFHFINEALEVAEEEEFILEAGVHHKRKLVLIDDSTAPLATDADAHVTDDDCFVPLLQRAELSVNTAPWSAVYLDGRLVGTTPVFRHAVATGGHVLRMIDGNGRTSFTRFEATAGEVIKIQIKLSPN